MVDIVCLEVLYGIGNWEDVVLNFELVIMILLNLFSVNIDVGLKYLFNIGYYENVEIRIVFVKVLYNIFV